MREKTAGGRFIFVVLGMMVGVLLLVATLTGCEGDEPESVEVRATDAPTVEPVLEPTLGPTVVPRLTKTPTPEPLPTVESVPTAVAVPTVMPTATEVPTPTATPTMTPEEIAVVRLSEIVLWVGEPPDRVHAEVRSLLVELWWFDAEIAEELAGLDWVVDGVSREESETIGLLAGLAYEDLVLASTILGFPKVSSGEDADSLGAVHVIERLWGTDADLTREVLGLGWVIDGLDGEELRMLSAVTDVAERGTGLGGLIFELPWLTDDVLGGELEIYLSIVEVAARDREVARVLWELSWVEDGVDLESSEAMAFAALMAAFEIEKELLWDLLHFGWIDDGINEFEGEAVEEVVATMVVLGSENAKSRSGYLEFAWASSMGSREDLLGFEQINRLIALDQIVGMQAARLPWVGGRLYDAESRLFTKVEEIVVARPLFAGLVLDLPWVVDGVEVGEVATVTRLFAVWEANPGAAEEIAMWTWLGDGLDGNEMSTVEEIGEFYGELLVGSPVVADEFIGIVGVISVEPPLEVSTVANALGRIARLDGEMGLAVMRFEWLTDGVSEGEFGLLGFVAELAETVALAQSDPKLPGRFAQLPWVVEGSTDIDPEVMLALLPLAEVDIGLADRVAAWTWERNGMKNFDPGPGSHVGELLGEVARLDVELAYQIVEMPWLTDGVGLDDEIALEVLSYSAIELVPIDRELAESVLSHVRGFTFPVKSDGVGLTSWLRIVSADPGTWEIVRELDWLTDGITEAEDIALSEISWAAEELPVLGGFALGLPWVSDGITDQEVAAIVALLDLGEADLVLADRVSSHTWVTDGIDTESLEPEAFGAFKRISSVDIGLARDVVEFDWVGDGIVDAEVVALLDVADSLEVLVLAGDRNAERYLTLASNFDLASGILMDAFFELGELISSDVASAEIVLNTQFFDDGEFVDDEFSGLLEVIRYTSSDPDIGLMISELDWVLDGVDFWERDALLHVSRFFEIDPELGSKAVEIGWIVSADDADPGGQLKSMTQLLEIAILDAEFAGEMMDWDWIRDGPSYVEPNLLGIVYEIMSLDPRIAKLLPLVVADGFERVDDVTFDIANTAMLLTSSDPEQAYSLLEEAKDWTPTITRFALEAVLLMNSIRPDDLERLTRQSWYRDGVDIDEAVVIGALASGVRSGNLRGIEDTFIEDLLRSHHVQKRRVNLPLAGDVTVWVVKHRPSEQGENLAADMGASAKEVEAFFDQPFPAKDLIVVVAEGNSTEYFANFRDHVLFSTSWPGTNIPSESTKGGLVGYYLRDRIGELWLANSAADFLGRYPDERAFVRRESYHRRDLTDFARQRCFNRYGIDDLQGAIDFHETGRSVNYCAEALGSVLLYDLFELVGWDAMGRALGDIYEKSTSIVDEKNTLFSVSEESLYESFLSNASRGSEEDVRDLYERLHGGRFLYPAEAVVEFDALPEEVREPLLWGTKWRDRPDYDVSSEKYLLALSALSEIWAIDEELAYDVARLGWVQESVNHVMTEALKRIGEVATADLSLARHLVDSPSMDNSRAVGVRYAVDAIRRLTETDMRLAWEVARSQWITGNWDDTNTLFLQALADFGAADADSARAVMRTHWITDGLTTAQESEVIWELRYNVRNEPRLLEHLVKYDWLAIGARSRGEPDTNAIALQFIAKTAEIDGDLAVELSKVAWVQDNIDQNENVGIQRLRFIALLDVRRAKEVVRTSWFQGRMTLDERGQLNEILNELERR